jgi:hypothetical protein
MHGGAAKICCLPHVASYKLRERNQAKSDYEIDKMLTSITGWLPCNRLRGSHVIL